MTHRRSLRRFLGIYSLVFVVLNLGGLALSVLLLWSWGDASREALRLTEMIAMLKEVRGTAYRQVKEAFDSQFLGDAEAQRQYREFAERIGAQLRTLKTLAVSADERNAFEAVRRGYEGIAGTVASSSGGLRTSGSFQELDTLLEQRDFRDFETALGESEAALALKRSDQYRLAHRLLAFVPGLLAVSFIASIATLYWSRRYLAKNVVEPLRALERSMQALPDSGASVVTLGQAASEIQHVSETFSAMAAELDRSRRALMRAEKDAAFASLVPVLAHNIRNPLASIRAAAQVSESAVEDCATRDALRAIVRTADRIEEWTRAMLSYLGPMQPKLDPCDLRELCDTALELLSGRIEERKVRIERRGWEEPCQVFADSILMEQALHGLLANAVDASPRGGTLHLSISMRLDERQVAIEDEGAGMPFRPCGSGLTAGPSTKQYGTGLGIPFAQRVCELHGAVVEFGSAQPSGTRVTIRFGSRLGT